MNFSAWSIRNPIAPLLAFALLMVVGVQAFYKLPITRFPNIDVPIVAISVSQSGAAPAEMEMQVTKEIEDAVAGISGVDTVTSTVTDGNSQTVVMFRIETPTNQAVQDVKDAIDRIRNSLPASINTPVVTKIDVEGQAIQSFAVSSPNMTLEELSWFVDDTIKRALQGQAGVGRIDRYGGSTREVQLMLDPVKMDSFGITSSDVNLQLRQMNVDLGSGRSQVAGGEQAIRTLGDARSVDTLKNTTITLPSGRFIKLSELGTITDAYQEPKSFSRYNGNPVVSFGVFRSKGASEVSVAKTVTEALDDVRAKHPDVTLTKIDDQVYFTQGNYDAAIDTLLEGAILAVIVVFIFLRNWRATLISAIALPLSAIPTFWVMSLMGFSLNLVSFLALTLATGILVDDAIVEIENIARHIKMGKTPYRAAIEAADEIGLAVIATTFTIIAVFVPVSFMPGIPGQYFIQFGLTVAFSVFFSLAVARLITPMMAAYFMRANDGMDDHGEHEGLFMRGYTRLVRAAMAFHGVPTVILAFAFLVGSVMLLLQVPGSFLPPDDASRISLSIELPPSASLADTDKVAAAIYERTKDINGVKDVYVLGGSSPKGELELRRAAVTLELDKREHSLVKTLVNNLLGRMPLVGQFVPKMKVEGRVRPQSDIEQEVFAKLRDVPDIHVLKLNDRGDRDLAFNLLSNNEEDLNAAVSKLESKMRADPLFANTSSEGALPRSELRIVPRKDQIARLGISVSQIAEVVRVGTIGDIDSSLSKISLDGRLIPIRVMLNTDLRTNLSAIKTLKVRTATGITVPLATVADISYAEGASSIKRIDRNRFVIIGADLPKGVVLDQATKRFGEILKEANLPPTVIFKQSGDSKVQNEMKASFGNAMLLGLLLVLVVLILLFRNVIQPFTILFSLPLAIGGVAVGLLVTNNAFSMPVMIGMLMLMGIVTKNAILLVDFAIEMMAKGMKRTEAMMEAGRKRARPIIMTSIAMSAGMLPSALGVGEGGSFRSPMAIAVIGGIIVSTVLSLVVVPAFFIIMDDLSHFLAWVFSRVVGKKEQEPEVLEPETLTRIATDNSRILATLEERILTLEAQTAPTGQKKAEKPASNVIQLPPLAAE